MAGKIVHLLSAAAIAVTTGLGVWFFIGIRYEEFDITTIISNILN